MEKKIDLSAIIVYYEKYEYDEIKPLFEAYKENLDKVNLSYEVVFVIDGNMPEVLREVQEIANENNNLKINYCPGTSVVEIKPKYNNVLRQYEIDLSTEIYNAPIFFTLDGSEPATDSPVYNDTIILKESAIIKAATVVQNRISYHYNHLKVDFHKVLGCTIDTSEQPSEKYGNLAALTDGISGSLNHNDGYWCGFLGKSPEFILDMEQFEQIKSIKIGTLHNTNAWIFRPNSIRVDYSMDGENWLLLGDISASIKDNVLENQIVEFCFDKDISARFLKIKVNALEQCPDWFIARGDPCWLFIDEIIVN